MTSSLPPRWNGSKGSAVEYHAASCGTASGKRERTAEYADEAQTQPLARFQWLVRSGLQAVRADPERNDRLHVDVGRLAQGGGGAARLGRDDLPRDAEG